MQLKAKKVLTDEQIGLLTTWILVNDIDSKSLDAETDLKNGVRVFGIQKSTDEKWEIDFVFKGDEE